MNANIVFQRFPDKPIELKRVNVFLGANGSGKSKILDELNKSAIQFYKNRAVVFVEGGRVINISERLVAIRTSGNTNHETLENSEQTHSGKAMKKLSSRIFDAFILLEKQGQYIKDIYSDLASEWEQSDRSTPVPKRDELPLDRLFNLFSQIFPTIKLSFDIKSKRIFCSKNDGSLYSPGELSDGEKQVLSILADIAILAGDNRLVIVDEPELNLNPLLAKKLWETIENEMPDSVFVYATHDIGFVMRPNVEKVFILSSMTDEITEITNINEINRYDLKQLLGSIPAILSTNNALITEGKSDSFDAIFYRWLLRGEQIEIIPMESCNDVFAAANKTGVWETIAPSVNLKGVVDRDFRSDEFLDQLSSASTKVLDFHEAESYLCIPKAVQLIAERLGIANIPSIGDIEDLIIKNFTNAYIEICAKRVAEKSRHNVSLTVEREKIKGVTTDAALIETILKISTDEAEKVSRRFGEGNVQKLLEEEIALCKRAIDARDIHQILKLLPAKNIIHQLAQIVGLPNNEKYIRAFIKHIDGFEIEEIKQLREQLSFEVFAQEGEASATAGVAYGK